jgi:hypothetical protein
MKRASLSLFVVTTFLIVSLVCGASSAQPSQVNDSHFRFKPRSDTSSVRIEYRPSFAGKLTFDTPGHNSDNLIAAPPPQHNVASPPPAYYFYEPYPMRVNAWLLQVGGSVSLVPYAEDEAELPMPGLDVQYKRGLFENISLAGSFSTSYFSNLLHVGLQWSGHQGPLSYGFAGHVGGAYGFMNSAYRKGVFDKVEAYGFFTMPMLRFGYRFDDFSISSSLVITYVFVSKSFVNTTPASVGPQNSINDYYATLVVEQPFLRDLQLSIGISLGYARTPYQSWMLYNTTNEWLFVPEFFFAVQIL